MIVGVVTFERLFSVFCLNDGVSEIMGPELIIEYDMQLKPIAAKCSHCGEKMPRMESKLISSDEISRWFQIQFQLHKRRKHRVKPVDE